MRVRLSLQAQDNLRAITAWLIRNVSERTAKRVARDLRSASRQIGASPDGFVKVGTLLGRAVHRLPYQRWAILYWRFETEVVVIRIADASQDYLAWLDPQ